MNINHIGKRMTRPRKMVVEALSRSSTPKTAQEIHRETKDIDLASVYRNLELLAQTNIVSVYEFGDGKKRYELVRDEHHHHLVCNSCGDIKDVEMKESELIDKVEKKTDFKIQRHSLEFFGLCPNCQ